MKKHSMNSKGFILVYRDRYLLNWEYMVGQGACPSVPGIWGVLEEITELIISGIINYYNILIIGSGKQRKACFI
jgi:hypothetical protein